LAATFQISVLGWMKIGADDWSEITRKVHQEYEQLRETLPPEVFATLPPPPERLAAGHARHDRQRREFGDAPKEWALTLLELSAAGLCVALAVPGRRREDREG
jgi:hypothetical protein